MNQQNKDLQQFASIIEDFEYPENIKLFFVLWWVDPVSEKKKSRSFPVNNLCALPALAKEISGKNHVYFGLGLREKNFNKGKYGDSESVKAIIFIWTEFDVLDGVHTETRLPETKAEAVEIAYQIIPELPPSIIIDSGGGIYAFWFFKEAWLFEDNNERQKGQQLLDRLQATRNKNATKYKFDPVANLSRVFRLPGSMNIKDPDNKRLAYIKEYYPDRRYNPDDFEEFLVPLKDTTYETLTDCSDAQNISEEDYPVADFKQVANKCGFIAHCKDDAKSLSEPEWWAMGSNVIRCEDGENLFYKLSEPYPEYTRKETKEYIKKALKQRPHTCVYIEAKINSAFCKGCDHFGKIKAPVVLGHPTLPTVIFKDQIEELNKKHAAVMVGGKFVVMNEVVDPAFDRPDITFSSVSDFKNCYSNRKVNNPKKGKGNNSKISIANIWLESPARRQYEGIVFSPGKKVSKKHYNLYRGLAVKPKKGEWSKMKDHINKIIAHGNAELAKWVLAWMARIVQDPGGERPGTCIVLRGEQGSGKGCLITNFGLILGPHFLHIYNQGLVMGRFNSHLKDAILVFLDEGFWTGKPSDESILKGMITEEHNMIEPKFRDPFPVKNHVNIMIASNKEKIVSTRMEERRFLVLDLSNEKVGDQEYFKDIYDQMGNGGREAMLYDLLKMDISGVGLRTIPRTKGLLEHKIDSMSTVEKYWYECLQVGTMPAYLEYTEEEWDRVTEEGWDKVKFVSTKLLHERYIKFAVSINDKKERLGPSVFVRNLNKLCTPIKSTRPILGDKGRVYCLVFPSLESCRQQFEKLVKQKIDWESEDKEN